MCLFMLSLVVVSVIATIASHITLMVIDTKETGELGSLDGTVGDLYTPVGTQLAGIYPVVVLLISQDYILDRTVQAFASGVEIQTGFHFSDMEENRSRDGGTTGYWNGHQRFWGIECPECMIFIICLGSKGKMIYI
ncbi:hypothetical protein F5879DRAFT_925932 [Lentinula edodes]|nr:hypothetical protein F5879DRAFT_925932 [Lentinula edodes]